jgi:hypothetical protein
VVAGAIASKQLTLKKYKSRPRAEPGALLLFPTWPMITRIKQMAEAMVRAMGVMMHAKRPILPILAIEGVLRRVETRRPTSDAAYQGGSGRGPKLSEWRV